MKKKTFIVLTLIFMLTIGYAAVNTTIELAGIISFGMSDSDFDIYFSDAKVNGINKKSVIRDDKTIFFKYNPSLNSGEYILEYDVTNGSRNYDAKIDIECENSNEKIIVRNELNTTEDLYATETRSGTLTVFNLDMSTEEKNRDYEITCIIVSVPRERDSLADGTPAEKVISTTSFAEDSWETIQEAVQSGNYIYQVGDTKTVTIAAHSSIPKKEITLRVVNTTPCTNGETSETACGFVVEFVDIIEKHRFNATNTNVGGWKASELRTYMNGTLLNALPEELQNIIVDTKVISGHGSTSGETNFETTDKLYLLSAEEVWGSNSYDTSVGTSRQLDYYKNAGVTSSNYAGAIKQYNESNYRWWLRTAVSSNSDGFRSVDVSGLWASYNASGTNGVSPTFRIGTPNEKGKSKWTTEDTDADGELSIGDI